MDAVENEPKVSDWEEIEKKMNMTVGLQKQKRTGLKKTYAVRILPPDFREDEETGEVEYYLYFTTRNFKSKSMKCSRHVWRRAEGRSGPGVVRDGFDSLSSKHDFLLYHEGEGEDAKVVAVDILPSTTYNAKTNAPENVQDQEYIELAINSATGEIQFQAVPIGVSKTQLQQLIAELDKVDSVNAGDTLGKAFYVYELQGNRLKVEPPPRGVGMGRPGQVGL